MSDGSRPEIERPLLCTIEETGRLLGYRRSKIYALIDDGDLILAAPGRVWRNSIDRYVALRVQLQLTQTAKPRRARRCRANMR